MIEQLSCGWPLVRIDLKYLLQQIDDLLIVGVQQLLDCLMLFDVHTFNNLKRCLILEIGKVLHRGLPSNLKYFFELRNSRATLKYGSLHDHLSQHAPHTPHVYCFPIVITAQQYFGCPIPPRRDVLGED